MGTELYCLGFFLAGILLAIFRRNKPKDKIIIPTNNEGNSGAPTTFAQARQSGQAFTSTKPINWWLVLVLVVVATMILIVIMTFLNMANCERTTGCYVLPP
jgi:hypothetical protein